MASGQIMFTIGLCIYPDNFYFTKSINFNDVSATLFVELWKRRQAILVWEWDMERDDQVY